MKTSAERFSMQGDKYLGRLYSEMDCQAFVEQCMFDAGLKMDLGGSNSWYRKMTWRGSPEDCKKTFGTIPKGALLFILEPVSSSTPAKFRDDGIGDATHIGIYTGRTGQQMVDHAVKEGDKRAVNYNFGNGAIHSSSSRKHVCTSNFAGKSINGGWNRIGLFDIFSYGDKIDAILSGTNDEGNGKGEKPMNEEIKFGIVDADGQSVNLRDKPSTSCKLWWKIPSGNVIDIDDESADPNGEFWYHGTTKDENGKIRTGWMMTKYVRIETPAGVDTKPDYGDDEPPRSPGDGKGNQKAPAGNEKVTITISENEAVALYSVLKEIVEQIGKG